MKHFGKPVFYSTLTVLVFLATGGTLFAGEKRDHLTDPVVRCITVSPSGDKATHLLGQRLLGGRVMGASFNLQRGSTGKLSSDSITLGVNATYPEFLPLEGGALKVSYKRGNFVRIHREDTLKDGLLGLYVPANESGRYRFSENWYGYTVECISVDE